MTSSRNQDGEGKKPTGESVASVSQQRRRLIKGAAAAAPGIFTLYSGNAQAMLSTYQCIAATRDAFTGNEEFAGKDPLVDGGFIRLAEETRENRRILAINKSGETRTLLKVRGDYGGKRFKFFEAGHAGRTGASWDQVWRGENAWKKKKINKGTPKETRQFQDPTSGEWFTEDKTAAPRIQVLACVDDNGNVVAASPSQCSGLTPTSGSCWASVT